jgi:hypothetical protein
VPAETLATHVPRDEPTAEREVERENCHSTVRVVDFRSRVWRERRGSNVMAFASCRARASKAVSTTRAMPANDRERDRTSRPTLRKRGRPPPGPPSNRQHRSVRVKVGVAPKMPPSRGIARALLPLARGGDHRWTSSASAARPTTCSTTRSSAGAGRWFGAPHVGINSASATLRRAIRGPNNGSSIPAPARGWRSRACGNFSAPSFQSRFLAPMSFCGARVLGEISGRSPSSNRFSKGGRAGRRARGGPSQCLR